MWEGTGEYKVGVFLGVSGLEYSRRFLEFGLPMSLECNKTLRVTGYYVSLGVF